MASCTLPRRLGCGNRRIRRRSAARSWEARGERTGPNGYLNTCMELLHPLPPVAKTCDEIESPLNLTSTSPFRPPALSDCRIAGSPFAPFHSAVALSTWPPALQMR